jgi:hypothetical protein
MRVVEETCLSLAQFGYRTRRIEASSLRTTTNPRTCTDYFPGLLPVSTAQSQVRSDGALQNVCCPRTSRTMYLPPAERVASTGQADKHGTGAGPERA